MKLMINNTKNDVILNRTSTYKLLNITYVQVTFNVLPCVQCEFWYPIYRDDMSYSTNNQLIRAY